MSIEIYQKIETLYKRDMEGTFKLIEGNFRNKIVEYLKDNQWLFTEKVDGMNIRVYWDGYKISFYGRSKSAILPAHLLTRLTEIFIKPEMEQVFEQLFGKTEAVLFGEGYGKKIQNGENYIKDNCDFILFDVFTNNKYLPIEEARNIANVVGINYVPFVMVDTIDKAVEYIKSKPKSIIAENKDYEMEGLVGKPMVDIYDNEGSRIIVKIKSRDFECKEGGVNDGK